LPENAGIGARDDLRFDIVSERRSTHQISSAAGAMKEATKVVAASS